MITLHACLQDHRLRGHVPVFSGDRPSVSILRVTEYKLREVMQNQGAICKSLTQSFINISITIDTWATCFDSYRVIFRPSRNTDPITKGVKCTVGSPMLSYIHTYFYVWVSVHHKLIYIKRTNVMQLGSMFICNCNIAVHVSDAFCIHLQEHLEIVEAACGE